MLSLMRDRAGTARIAHRLGTPRATCQTMHDASMTEVQELQCRDEPALQPQQRTGSGLRLETSCHEQRMTTKSPIQPMLQD